MQTYCFKFCFKGYVHKRGRLKLEFVDDSVSKNLISTYITAMWKNQKKKERIERSRKK